MKNSTYQMTLVALMSAIMCIVGPISIPIGPVPVSLTVMIVYLAVFILGKRLGMLSYGIYFLLGMAGLPVFSGYMGGIGKVLGPTGGYLVGIFALVFFTGIFLERFPHTWYLVGIGMILGMGANYFFGTFWFVYQMKCSFLYAATVCIFPFILPDLIKIGIALVLGIQLRKRLRRAGLL